MRRNGEEVFKKITFLGGAAADSLAAATLLAIRIHIRALDVPRAGDRDDDGLIRDQLFQTEVADRFDDFGASQAGVLSFELLKIRANDVQNEVLVAQNGFVPFNLYHELGIVIREFFDLQPGQSLELHGQDGAGLNGGEVAIRR